MAEFDHELNCIYGFDPDTVTLGSSKKVHWICSKRPQGKLHRWQASPKHRTWRETKLPLLQWQMGMQLQLLANAVA